MPAPASPAAWIAHILARYHDTHRRELPELVRMARVLGAGGVGGTLAEDLARRSAELAQHRFQEEMRLFPMMEQGGHILLVHPMDDMQAEHAVQIEDGHLFAMFRGVPDAA